VAYIKSLSQPEQLEPVSNRPAVPQHPAPAPARSR
jgi:hypothetical protein